MAWSHCWPSVRWFSGDVVVAVPGLDVAVIELDEPHAPLDQPAGDQELPGLDAGAVQRRGWTAAPGSTSKASVAAICMR